MQNHWKQLQSSFELPEQELRAALCRITHFQQGEVLNLREHEQSVANWLAERKIDAPALYRQSRSKKSEYSRRYTETRRYDKWRLVLDIKAQLSIAFPDKTPEQIRKMIRRIGRCEYGEIQKLKPEEYPIKELLLKYKIKSATLYQWLLQTLVPDDVREKIENGTISGIQARRAIHNREIQRRAALELTLLEQARLTVKEVLSC